MRDRRYARVRGPLAPYAAGFRAELESRGYTPVSAGHRLGQFRQDLPADALAQLDAATQIDHGFPATFIRDTSPWVFGAATPEDPRAIQ